MEVGDARTQSRGALHVRDPQREIARLIIEEAQVVQGVRMLRVQVERLPIKRLGSGTVARLVLRQCAAGQVISSTHRVMGKP